MTRPSDESDVPDFPLLPPPIPGHGEPPHDLAPAETPSSPRLMSFFSLTGAELALAESAFTQQELIARMIDHVRHPNPKVSQQGIRLFNAYALRLATLNGQVGTARTSRSATDASGAPVTQSLSASVLTHLSSPLPSTPPNTGRTFLPPHLAPPASRPPEESHHQPPQANLDGGGPPGRTDPG